MHTTLDNANENKRITVWLEPDRHAEGVCDKCFSVYRSKYNDISNREWLIRERERIGSCKIMERNGKQALFLC